MFAIQVEFHAASVLTRQSDKAVVGLDAHIGHLKSAQAVGRLVGARGVAADLVQINGLGGSGCGPEIHVIFSIRKFSGVIHPFSSTGPGDLIFGQAYVKGCLACGVVDCGVLSIWLGDIGCFGGSRLRVDWIPGPVNGKGFFTRCIAVIKEIHIGDTLSVQVGLVATVDTLSGFLES